MAEQKKITKGRESNGIKAVKFQIFMLVGEKIMNYGWNEINDYRVLIVTYEQNQMISKIKQTWIRRERFSELTRVNGCQLSTQLLESR